MNGNDRKPASGFSRLIGALARRTAPHRIVGRENPLDAFNDHYLRDIGIRRERYGGRRRSDPWL